MTVKMFCFFFFLNKRRNSNIFDLPALPLIHVSPVYFYTTASWVRMGLDQALRICAWETSAACEHQKSWLHSCLWKVRPGFCRSMERYGTWVVCRAASVPCGCKIGAGLFAWAVARLLSWSKHKLLQLFYAFFTLVHFTCTHIMYI